jgi:hypothetical protein
MSKHLLPMMVLLFFTLFISCEKDDTNVLKSIPKEDLKQCRGCSGTYDLTDTIS